MKKSLCRHILSLLFILTALLVNAKMVFAYPSQNPLPQEELEITVQMGFEYLATQLNEDGGIRWTDENSSVSATTRVVLALAANHYPQNYLTSSSGNSPIDFLKDSGTDWVYQRDTENPDFNMARAGQLLTAAAAANENPRAFGRDPVDIIQEIKARYDSTLGVYGLAVQDNVTDQVWGMLGLSASSQPIPSSAAEWLIEAQLEDGSWNDGYNSYLDTTPLAVLALIASGHSNTDSPEIQNALGFLQDQQQPDGGWQTQWDETTNANTTGMILQAIAAAGQSPTDDTWQQVVSNPLAAIQSLQKENGVIGGEYANAYSTADALLGLSTQPFFFLGNLTRANRVFEFIHDNQLSDGGWGAMGQTIDVLLALGAAGWDPNSISNEGAKPLDYIAENFDSYIESGPAAVGKLILGMAASGKNPANFEGHNLPQMLIDTYEEDASAFGNPENTWHQSLGILGLHAAGEEIPEGAVETLKSLQAEDGGWEYSLGMGTWPASTALALQALLAADLPFEDTSIQQGLNYIAEMQSENGGWGDSSTTSFVLMALNALGQSPAQWKTDLGLTPLPDLISYQKLNGAFVFTRDFPDDSLMSTAAAMVALFGGNYLFDPSHPPLTSQAGLIVDPNTQGEKIEKCLPVEESSLSGMAFLVSADLEIATDQGFINGIAGFSNPNGETLYWSYWHWDGREWQFYESGASQTTVLPGSIQIWYLTSWEEFPSKPPKYAPDLKDICGANVLKNYQAQPYLNFNDFQDFSRDETTEDDSTMIEEPESTTEIPTGQSPIIETTQMMTPVPYQEPQQEFERQIIPLLIIGILGIGTLILIIMLLKRRRQ